MGVYNNVSISNTDAETRATSLTNYLDNLDRVTAELITETVDAVEYIGAAFSIDGTNINGFLGFNTGSIGTYKYLMNGDIYLIQPSATGAGSAGVLTIHSYIDSECVLLSMYDSHTTSDGIQFMVSNINSGMQIVGYKALTTAAFVDISSLVFENISDSARIEYTYSNMFPYTAAPGTLDFLAQAYFVNNGIRKYTSSLLKECSTVSLLSTVSLPTPLNNHLAIGTHCIVPLDDEEGGNE